MFFQAKLGGKNDHPNLGFWVIFAPHLLSGFSEISSYSSIQPNQPNSGQIWVNFGQTGPFLKYRPKSKNVIIFRLQRLCFEQKIRKFRCIVLEKNAKNLHFWSFLAKMANFGHISAKMREKAIGPFLPRLQALTAKFQ